MLKKILVRIQWRTLLCCGIGLWIALCANDLYYNGYNELMLSADKVFPATTTAHQVTIETDSALMSISHFIEKGRKSWGTVRKSRILTTFVVIFVSIWSIFFILCVQEYAKKKSKKLENTKCLKKELNPVKKTSKSTGIQVSYPSRLTSTFLNYEWNEKRSSQEWFSTIKSSLNVSYAFKEEKNEDKIIYKGSEKREEEICNNSNNECNEHKIECLCNGLYIYQCKPVFQLIYYINLSRSVHFQSTLLSRRYTISIFNTFSSLSVTYLFNSLSLRYSSKKNDFFDDNNKKEKVNVNKPKTIKWSSKKNKDKLLSEYFGKTNRYIISSSPGFQQFVENFMNIRYIQPTYA